MEFKVENLKLRIQYLAFKIWLPQVPLTALRLFAQGEQTQCRERHQR